MKNFILLLFLLLLNELYRAQTIYYVDGTNGNDLNTGTSLGSAWQTIQKACNSATPNSIVKIKGGTYHENIVVNVSGSIGNAITFRNYNTDIVIIDGTGTNGTTMLTISNKNYLNFENLTIQNLTVANAQGILVETTGISSSTNLSFKNITITGINWTSSSSTIPTSNDNAQGLIVYGRDGGITNLTLDSCNVFNNILGFSEAVSIDGNVDGFTVKNCTVHDNTNIGIDLAGNYGTSANSATDQARHGVVQNNICYNNISLYATSGGIYVDGGRSIVIEKNKCYGNGNGIEIGCEENGTVDSIDVKNNLVYNNQEAGISVGGYTTSTTGQVINSTIRNNTLLKNNYANDGTGELVITKASNCVFENNIFYTNNQDVLMSVDNILPQTSNVFNYNCWYTNGADANNITINWRSSTYTSFVNYKNATLQEANSLFANPLLTSISLPNPDLHISSNSTCVNGGAPTTSIANGETDYDGNARIANGGIDIGAFEYGSISTLTENFSKYMQNIIVYPNPFNEQINISLNTPLINGTISIYNALGQLKKQVSLINTESTVIQTHDLTKGIYFLKISDNGSNKVEQCIIAN